MWPTVECVLNECTVITCSYYFPEAFWNHHLTEYKTVIQLAAHLQLLVHALMPTQRKGGKEKIDLVVMHKFASLTPENREELL